MPRSQVVIFKMRNATLDPIWNKHTWQYENVYTCWTWNNTQTLIWTLCGKRCICRLIFFQKMYVPDAVMARGRETPTIQCTQPFFFHSKNLLLHFWHIMLPMHILPEECTTWYIAILLPQMILFSRVVFDWQTQQFLLAWFFIHGACFE